MITIVDYGAGNIRSVEKAFQYIGVDAEVTSNADKIAAAERLVLPGVGAFADAMYRLQSKGLVPVLEDYAASGRPMLGICLGMQLMFDYSEEGEAHGLSFVPGRIHAIPQDEGIKVPQIGWNNLEVSPTSRLLKGVPDNSYFYFVHSYCLDAVDKEIVTGCVQHGITIEASFEKDNLFGTQFHPEKSSDAGLIILKNFASI